jgi:ABC-2 type transport system permease protein
MRALLTIFSKEMRVYFTTWISYVFLAVFTIFAAYVFQDRLGRFQQISFQFLQMQATQYLEHLNLTDMVLAPLFAQMAVIMLFLLPVLTMRLITEERQQRTMELLMTLPVRSLDIILGKYLAAFVMVLAALALLLIFPLLLYIYGGADQGSPIDWNTVWTAYLGLTLFAAAGLAIGLFWSSMTQSLVVAGIGTFITLLMLWVLGWKGYGEAGFWSDLLGYISIINHIESFVRGLVRLQDIVYYLSLTFVGIFMAHRMVEAQRWQ